MSIFDFIPLLKKNKTKKLGCLFPKFGSFFFVFCAAVGSLILTFLNVFSFCVFLASVRARKES